MAGLSDRFGGIPRLYRGIERGLTYASLKKRSPGLSPRHQAREEIKRVSPLGVLCVLARELRSGNLKPGLRNLVAGLPLRVPDHLLGVRQRLIGDYHSAQHPGDLLHPLRTGKGRDLDPQFAVLSVFGNLQMTAALGGHLG